MCLRALILRLTIIGKHIKPLLTITSRHRIIAHSTSISTTSTRTSTRNRTNNSSTAVVVRFIAFILTKSTHLPVCAFIMCGHDLVGNYRQEICNQDYKQRANTLDFMTWLSLICHVSTQKHTFMKQLTILPPWYTIAFASHACVCVCVVCVCVCVVRLHTRHCQMSSDKYCSIPRPPSTSRLRNGYCCCCSWSVGWDARCWKDRHNWKSASRQICDDLPATARHFFTCVEGSMSTSHVTYQW